jgi:murein DD-endopeptidase MepM/ murein hydrolase activator NlpD
MKILILTAEKSTLSWKSLDKKLAYVKSILNTGKNANFTLAIEYTPTIPKLNGDKIDHTWLQELILPYFNKGNDIVAFHFSKKQQTAWGILPSLRGANPKGTSEAEAVYFWADEDTLRLGYNQFEQTLLHELAHAYFQWSKEKDTTHEYHDKHKNIAGLFASFDWIKYQPRRMALKAKKNLLERIVEALRASVVKKEVPQLPIPFLAITQGYGVYNPTLYPSTGYHWGTDLRATIGTKIKAPLSGEIIEAGDTSALGFYLQMKLNDGNYMVVPHLAKMPVKGKYKQGEVIGELGATGKIVGVHFHVEIWKKVMSDRVNQLKNHGWTVTTDPAVYFNLKK